MMTWTCIGFTLDELEILGESMYDCRSMCPERLSRTQSPMLLDDGMLTRCTERFRSRLHYSFLSADSTT